MAAVRGDASPHPIDLHIGRRLRALRREHRLSQADLASQIGVTYQQVQKYETGANRISASALFDLALALGEPVAAFYAGLPETAASPDCDPAAFAARDTLLGHPAGRRLLLALSDTPRPLWPSLTELLEGLLERGGRGAGPSGVLDAAAAWDDSGSDGAVVRLAAARPSRRLQLGG